MKPAAKYVSLLAPLLLALIGVYSATLTFYRISGVQPKGSSRQSQINAIEKLLQKPSGELTIDDLMMNTPGSSLALRIIPDKKDLISKPAIEQDAIIRPKLEKQEKVLKEQISWRDYITGFFDIIPTVVLAFLAWLANKLFGPGVDHFAKWLWKKFVPNLK